MRPLARIVLLLLALLGSFAVAQSDATSPVTLEAPAPVDAVPDSYETLIFTASGDGDAEVRIDLPGPEWTTTSQSRTVALDANGNRIPVTVRVPTSVPAGTVGRIEVQLVRDERALASATTEVTVLPYRELSLELPDQIEVDEVRDVVVPVEVTSRSNVDDVIDVSSSDPRVQFASRSVAVPAGTSQSLDVRFLTPMDTRPGRRYRFPVTLRPRGAPEVVHERFVTIRFAATNASQGPPSLRASLNVAASGAASTRPDGPARFDASISLSPRIEGRLSDFVAVRLAIGDLRLGTRGVTLPSSVAADLEGERWTARARYGASGIGAAGGWRSDDVDVQANVNNDLAGSTRARVRVGLRGELPDIDVTATLAANPDEHEETLTVRYRLPFDAVGASVGIGLDGRGDPSTYRITPLLTQTLSLGTQHLFLDQSLQTTPLDGRWAIGVTGGTRSLDPLGGRLAVRYDSDPSNVTIAATGSASYRPLEFLTLGADTAYRTTKGDADGGVGRLGVRVSAGGRIGAIGTSGSTRYRHEWRVYGDPAIERRLDASLRLSLPNADLRLTGRTVARSDAADAPTITAWSSRLVGTYRPGASTTIQGDVGYGRSGEPTTAYEFDASLAWSQRWSIDTSSTLRFRHTEERSETDDIEVLHGLQGSLTWNRAFGVRDGSLDLSYGLSVQDGLFGEDPSASHTFSASYAVTFATDLRTPDPLVSLFGGRYGGTVRGRAYVDHDLDGRFGQADAPLRDQTIAFRDDATARTDDEGRFVVAVPEGTYARIDLPGLGTGLGVLDDLDLTVERNADYDIEVRVAPVRSARVTLFDDLNRDGVRDDGEPLLTGTGVILDGPVRRTARSGPDGVAVANRLVEGEYAVLLDATQAPDRYEATHRPTVQIEPPGPPLQLTLGAAERPRQVVTTFSSGALAVFAQASPNRVQPGDTIQITGRTQGEPERATFDVFGERIALEPNDAGDVWTASWTVPDDAPLGRIEATVQVDRGEESMTTALPITIRAP
ncbi:MAG: hypothetical protein WD336_01780 [Trueperaceae bacterium]